eukprot:2691846-Amphidinium_carterae.1
MRLVRDRLVGCEPLLPQVSAWPWSESALREWYAGCDSGIRVARLCPCDHVALSGMCGMCDCHRESDV